jgi:condensin complex subunit 2
MAPSRPSRARKDDEDVPSYAESDSGGDTEQEEPTPKPHRTHSKKRVSDVYEGSFAHDLGRSPLKSVSLNDDAAEKRRRRKSAKMAMMSTEDNEAGPSGEGSAETERDPTRSITLGKQKQLLPVDEAPKINLPLDVMNHNFEEWMKMATDNVSSTAYFAITALITNDRKSMPTTHGMWLSLTTFTTCHFYATIQTILSTFSVPHSLLMAASRSGQVVSTV